MVPASRARVAGTARPANVDRTIAGKDRRVAGRDVRTVAVGSSGTKPGSVLATERNPRAERNPGAEGAPLAQGEEGAQGVEGPADPVQAAGVRHRPRRRHMAQTPVPVPGDPQQDAPCLPFPAVPTAPTRSRRSGRIAAGP